MKGAFRFAAIVVALAVPVLNSVAVSQEAKPLQQNAQPVQGVFPQPSPSALSTQFSAGLPSPIASQTYPPKPEATPPFSEPCDSSLSLPAYSLTDTVGSGEKSSTMIDGPNVVALLGDINLRLWSCQNKIYQTYHPAPKDTDGIHLLGVAYSDCDPYSINDYPAGSISDELIRVQDAVGQAYDTARKQAGPDDNLDVLAAHLLESGSLETALGGKTEATVLAVARIIEAKKQRLQLCALFANRAYATNSHRLLCNAVGPLGASLGLYAAIFSKRWSSGLQGGVPFFAANFPTAVNGSTACNNSQSASQSSTSSSSGGK